MKTEECRQSERMPGIQSLGPGLWRVRVQVIEERTGRHVDRMLKVAGTIEQAVAAKLRAEEAIRSGEEAQQRVEKVTIGEYAASWQQAKRLEGLAESTLREREQILACHILPRLGGYDLKRLTPADLLAWRRWACERVGARGRRPSPVTINGWWRVLEALIRAAYAEHQWGAPPTEQIRPLREADSAEDDEDRTLVEDEVLRLLAALRTVRPDIHLLAWVGFATGCRHCELSALRWPDVDWERRLLFIRRSHVHGTVREGTKTKGSRRKVVLLPELVEALRSHQEEQQRRRASPDGLAEGLIFPSAAGTPFSVASVSEGLQRAATAAGIRRKVSTKTFRRTWNTLAIRQGLDRALIQANTGHSTDSMTDHYSRFRTEHRAEAQQKVVGFLDRPVPGPTDRRP